MLQPGGVVVLSKVVFLGTGVRRAPLAVNGLRSEVFLRMLFHTDDSLLY